MQQISSPTLRTEISTGKRTSSCLRRSHLSTAEARNPSGVVGTRSERIRSRRSCSAAQLPALAPVLRPRPARLGSRRLIGGIELMQAIGLRLEENGTVLALREVVEEDAGGVRAVGGGGKWDRVPQSTLRRLDTAAKVMPSPQIRSQIDNQDYGYFRPASAYSLPPWLRCRGYVLFLSLFFPGS